MTGCGPGLASDDATESTTQPTTTQATATTSTSGEASTAAVNSTSVGTTTSPTPASTDDSSTGDASDGSSSTGPPATISHCVESWIGGSVRYSFWRRDLDNNLCTRFRIRDSFDADLPGPFMLPRPLLAEFATLEPDAENCGSAFGSEFAVSGSGWVEWASFPENSGWPDTVDFDVTLEFDPTEPWIPASVSMSGVGLPIVYDCEPQSRGWVPAPR